MLGQSVEWVLGGGLTANEYLDWNAYLDVLAEEENHRRVRAQKGLRT